MRNCFVLVADGARARFFCVEGKQYPTLREVEDLVNPARRMHPGERYSAGKAGMRARPGASSTQGFDDHRTRHQDELDRRFAKQIAEEAERLSRQSQLGHLVLGADAKMLGVLRRAFQDQAGFEIHEVKKDLTRASPTEIQDYLAGCELLPRRQRRPRV